MLVGRTPVCGLVGQRAFARREEAQRPGPADRARATDPRRSTSGRGRRLRSGGGPRRARRAPPRVAAPRLGLDRPEIPPARPAASRRRPGAEHQALEQRIAGEAIGAVDAGAGDLARRKQPGHRRASPQVGLDAAHDVVRRGTDGNPVARRDRARPHGTPRRWSGSARASTRHRGAASTGRPARRCGAARGRSRGTTQIARGQLAGRLVARHEALAVGVEQLRAFAAQRFRQQERGRRPARRARSGETARTRDR